MDEPWIVRTKLIQGPPGPGKLLSGSAVWSPAFVGALARTTVPVIGAIVGQSCALGFDQDVTSGATPSLALAQVTAPGVATVTLFALAGAPSLVGLHVRVDVIVRPSDV